MATALSTNDRVVRLVISVTKDEPVGNPSVGTASAVTKAVQAGAEPVSVILYTRTPVASVSAAKASQLNNTLAIRLDRCYRNGARCNRTRAVTG